MDSIFIRGLQIETIIGIYEWERTVRQTILVDLDIATNTNKAAASDNIGDTIDYQSVAEKITTFVENSQFFLVETLAEHIAKIVLDLGASWVHVVLHKKGALGGKIDVGISIERSKTPPI